MAEDHLTCAQELFDFLQGHIPEGYHIDAANVPGLTPDQAWQVVSYLSNLVWNVPVFIERCDICGVLFDSHSEGTCLDCGDKPYEFCEGCTYTPEYAAKERQSPDKGTSGQDPAETKEK